MVASFVKSYWPCFAIVGRQLRGLAVATSQVQVVVGFQGRAVWDTGQPRWQRRELISFWHFLVSFVSWVACFVPLIDERMLRPKQELDF